MHTGWPLDAKVLKKKNGSRYDLYENETTQGSVGQRTNGDRSKLEGSRVNGLKLNRAQSEQAKSERVKREWAICGRAKRGRAKRGRAKRGRAKRGRAKSERAKSERAKSEWVKEWATKRRIWSEYSAKGFWTLLGDDWELTKWAYNSKGHPTDYRFRVPALAMGKTFPSEMKRFSAAFCFRGQRYGEMMHEWFLNYLSAHRSFPQDRLFSWLWNTDCAHDILNGVKMADAPTKRLLQTMKEKGDLEKGVLIFLSDHGFRFGGLAKSSVGQMENNLPFFFIVFPTWFEQQFPELVANVRVNARRLFTGFDLHRTLQHLLHMQTSGTPWSNEAAAAASVDADGHLPQEAFSLLTRIPLERTCENAGIPDAFCGCFQLEEVDVGGVTFDTNDAANDEKQKSVVLTAKSAAGALLLVVNDALKDVFDICHKWKIAKLLKASKKPGEDKFMIRIEVWPEGARESSLSAIFQGWVVKNKSGSFDIKLGEASRLDKYGVTSQCVLKRAYKLKEYCRCKN